MPWQTALYQVLKVSVPLFQKKKKKGGGIRERTCEKEKNYLVKSSDIYNSFTACLSPLRFYISTCLPFKTYSLLMKRCKTKQNAMPKKKKNRSRQYT